jgi:hypothetical protein
VLPYVAGTRASARSNRATKSTIFMNARPFLLVMLLVGCQRTAKDAERRVLPDVESVASAGRANVKFATTLASTGKASGLDDSGGELPRCLGGDGLPESSQERIQRAVANCSPGLAAKTSATGWTVQTPSPAPIARYELRATDCIRVVVALNEPGYKANASLVDSANRTLSEASGSNVILIPKGGPLCLVRDAELVLVLSADNAPLAGLTVLLESQ